MTDLIQMKQQGDLYVPNDISDVCNDVAVSNSAVARSQNVLTPYQRERRDFLKKTGKFFGTVFGVCVGYKTIDNILGNEEAFAGNVEAAQKPNLEFKYGRATKHRKHSDKLASGDSYFYDVVIINNTDETYKIDNLIINTPLGVDRINGETLVKFCGSNIIPPRGEYHQKDRRATIWGKDIRWPITVKDVYILTDRKRNIIDVVSKVRIP